MVHQHDSTSMQRLQLAGLVRDAAYATEARAPGSASPAGAYHAAPPPVSRGAAAALGLLYRPNYILGHAATPLPTG